MFEKILIANRGEIACRVIRTCRRLGVRAAAVYSDADARAQHVLQADEAYAIGGPRPADSYLRIDAIVDRALRCGAQAVHPGYGFLSENADFAERVERAGLTFIGPSAASMRQMGSKAGAKNLMAAHGVPVVPGYTGDNQDMAHLLAQADTIGYPLMIKAAHGGGGKGMRIVRSREGFSAALESCQREAASAFGRDRVLLERYIETPRHVEIQIFGDRHGQIIHLFERECSAQRRYQKVLEESPSPMVTPALRAAMGEAAIAAGRALDYMNAGTVEFIVDAQGRFFFMEINTRLQVEHPVTEMVTGLDLVELQLRVASGEALADSPASRLTQPRGHAIEVRLYAEDPEKNFLPASGVLEELILPDSSPHVRVDSGVTRGDCITIHYDPMIAKLIVWDSSRPQALNRLREALADAEIGGLRHNLGFLERLVNHPKVIEGNIDTGYLDHHLNELMVDAPRPPAGTVFAATALVLLDEERASLKRAAGGADASSPWAQADAWRLAHAGKRVIKLGWRNQALEVHAHGSAGRYQLSWDGSQATVHDVRREGRYLHLRIDDAALRVRHSLHGHTLCLHHLGQRTYFERQRAFASNARQGKHASKIAAPMPGRVVAVKVAAGAAVAEGQELLVIEAMKMEITLRAPVAGVIAKTLAREGDFVEADAELMRYDDPAAGQTPATAA